MGSVSGVHVLAYHLVGAKSGTAVDVPLTRFEDDLKGLGRRCRSLGEALENGRPGDVVLTFDDAYANFYEVAYPMLRERGIPALLYVPTGFVDGTNGVPMRGTQGLAACTWAQLREMAGSQVVAIGAHTITHPSLTQVTMDQALRELKDGQARLEDELGMPVRHFCYPRALWNRRLEELVDRYYDTAVVGGGGELRPASVNPLRIQRIAVRVDSPPALEMVASRVWLEERVADLARRLRG